MASTTSMEMEGLRTSIAIGLLDVESLLIYQLPVVKDLLRRCLERQGRFTDVEIAIIEMAIIAWIVVLTYVMVVTLPPCYE